MNKIYAPDPHEIFTNIEYTHPQYHNFPSNSNQEYISEDFLRYADVYIQRFLNKALWFPLSRYNFSLFRSKHNDKSRLIVWEIKFISSILHEILNVTENTTVYPCNYFQGRPLWKLSTKLYPDAEYTLSLNYEDVAVGFLGFDFISDKEVFISQVQSSFITNINNNFKSKNHLLDWFKWRCVLLDFLEDYLQQNNFSWNVILQSAINNKHWKNKIWETQDQTTLRRDRLRISYDNLACDMWYIHEIDGKNGPSFMKSF